MAADGELSFRNLRSWNGEQSRAFEELAYQLLKDRAPEGSQAIRTGNPDGGVEWYAPLANGTEWGWQAKHVEGIDALLTAMTDSVKRVAKERTTLRKLTFAISWNLATGTSGGERKSQRQKYEDKIRAWQKDIPGANKIEFELVQESDLLDELAKPEHAGRRWFWWNQVVLGPAWLKQRYREQSDAAGEKYRPDLQVDIPIQEDLLALGFDASIVSTFDQLRRNVVSALDKLHLPPEGEDEAGAVLYRAAHQAASVLKETASGLAVQAGDPPAAVEALRLQLLACVNGIDEASDYERQLVSDWHELPSDDPRKEQKPPDGMERYSVGRLRRTVEELVSWLESSTGEAFQRRAYFLSGQAGSGKTHLLLDATRRALDASRPAVFLTGAQFGRSDLWASIADQLGLPPVGSDVLLQAMDAAGEAASVAGCRFLIAIDALNETTPADFWLTHLPRLRAAVARYAHVALVVTCRDTYEELVLEGSEGSRYVRRTHPGFAEREVEATHRYFAHYGLETPKIPLLTPEFTLPLFLRLYCESLSQVETAIVPNGHEGRVAIFERYLDAKVSRIARRLRSGATSSFELAAAKQQVRRTLDALLDAMASRGSESLSVTTADEVVRTALANPTTEPARVLGLLQEEGVLTRERLYLVSGTFEEGVRIVFQAFADFLLLDRRLAQSSDPLSDEVIKLWLAQDCSWGISEAAAVLFPERFGVELPDLLSLEMIAPPDDHHDRPAWSRHHEARRLYRTLVETLPYRDSKAVTQRTIDLLNDAQPYLTRTEFYDTLFVLAPQPDSPLNAERLHRYLLQQKMPERDSDFGFATYHELTEVAGAATRLARWAAAGPYPSYDAKVIELACIPLCWLLSSPNRFMRDWVTKALVQLLRGHLDVMRKLVERFWRVDDPYMVQRVVAIAYGALLRNSPTHRDQAQALAELVHRLVFSRPIRPDELLLDAARGVTRWAIARQLLPSAAADTARRPYGLKLPGPAPTEATIKARYGRYKDVPDDEDYSSLYFSLMGMGDFARYVVESRFRRFSRFKLGQPIPQRKPRQRRFIKKHWDAFVASLSDEQKTALADWLIDPGRRKLSRSRFMLKPEEDPLTDKQWELLDTVWVYPKLVVDSYPADAACRWIFQRTISLGWMPKVFGRRDRQIGHGRGRESHKAERWGKKYQWIAYHELLARVADNYQPSRLFGDTAYEDLHQLVGAREIDPSLPPIDYHAFNDRAGSGATAWDPSLIKLREWPPGRLDFSRYRGDITMLLADAESEPVVAGSLFVRDHDGGEWVVLDSYVKQVDPLADEGWRGLREASSINTLLVSASSSKALVATLPDAEWHAIDDLTRTHGHTDCCYVGEVGRTGPQCPHRQGGFESISIEDKTFEVAATTEEYTWEGSILDCSIGESATTLLPSTFLQQAAELTFDMRGPSWLDASGSPVFTHYEESGDDSRALLVRRSFLQSFLAEHKLELIVLHWYERMELREHYYEGKHPYVESRTDARLTAAMKIYQRPPRRTQRDLD